MKMRCSFKHDHHAEGPPCSHPRQGNGGDRCVFTSIMLLGALFALAAPVARGPMVVAFVLFGVPLMTFAVAAPTRIGLFRELSLSLRGIEASLLQVILRLAGRRQLAFQIRDSFRDRVEIAYSASGERLAEAVREDPLRLHHARRLASMGAGLTVFAGLGLPFFFPGTYTYGDFPEAPMVFAFDLITFGLVGRIVAERVMVRLFEVSHALRDGASYLPRMRATPLTVLLGAALGAVGGLVVVYAGAAACAIETALLDQVNVLSAALWFIRETAPHGLPLGIMIGVILGAGMGLAQSQTLPTAGKEE